MGKVRGGLEMDFGGETLLIMIYSTRKLIGLGMKDLPPNLK